MSIVHRIFESTELPIMFGTLEVDTTNGAVTVFMKSAPINSVLTITKVSSDRNMVSLFSENSLVDGAEITMFGLPIYAKVKKGKIKTIVLQSIGNHWKIIKEE